MRTPERTTMGETARRAAEGNQPEFSNAPATRAAPSEPTLARPASDSTSKDDAIAKPSSKRRWLLRSLVLLLILGLAGTGWWFYSHRDVGLDPDVPLWTPGMPSHTPVPSVPVPDGCAANPRPIEPVLFEITGKNYSWEMIPLGWDENDAAATPPLTKEGIRQIGWLNEGPWVGSDKGNVVLTAHTMVGSIGVGNEINTGILSPGDVVRLSDTAGVGVCYQYTHAIKIYVADYDPASGILYDNDGPPRLALVTCSSEDADTGELSARVIYYFELVGEPVTPDGDDSADESPTTPESTP
jgi:hypothetical protein